MIIQQRDREALRRLFADQLVNPVKLTVFTQVQTAMEPALHTACQFCDDTVELARELAALSGKISIEVHDFLVEHELAASRGVDTIPALLIEGARPSWVRYLGIPAGYEFSSLVEDVVDASAGTTRLASATRARLARLGADVHIKVFVTPTCPYCPRAVRMAHQMALESAHIRADAIEVSEFSHLAQKYRVMSVPKVVMNETTSIDGAVPEAAFLLHVLKAADQLSPDEKARFDELYAS